MTRILSSGGSGTADWRDTSDKVGCSTCRGSDRIRAQNRRSWSEDQRTSNQSSPYRALVSTAAGAIVTNSSRVGKSVSLRRSRQTYGIPRSSSTPTPLRAESVFKAVRPAGPPNRWGVIAFFPSLGPPTAGRPREEKPTFGQVGGFWSTLRRGGDRFWKPVNIPAATRRTWRLPHVH